MCDPCSRMRQIVRYWFFPKSRDIDENIARLDVQQANLKRQKQLVAEIVEHANQPDILRNLVIAMSGRK
jgi:hypothetical protein